MFYAQSTIAVISETDRQTDEGGGGQQGWEAQGVVGDGVLHQTSSP